MSASEDMSELCSCPPSEEYYWEAGGMEVCRCGKSFHEVDEWKGCFSISGANCHGARKRSRSVYCMRSNGWRAQRVLDAQCSETRPATMEACSGCDRQARLS